MKRFLKRGLAEEQRERKKKTTNLLVKVHAAGLALSVYEDWAGLTGANSPRN